MDYIVLSKVENLEEVISNFASELDEYLNDMNSEIEKLNEILVNLGNSWSGSEYDSFVERTIKKLNDIKEEIKKGKKLKEDLDESAEDYKILRNLLKKASE